ncbi:MAG: transposase [Candidatus Aenigmarchaeota archaeon]|nr:transposase [Candidatus Aenigmarchaeota archaeon]
MAVISYKFRIYPTREQEETLNRMLTLCRRLYNAALNQRIQAYHLGYPTWLRKQRAELPALKSELKEYSKTYCHVLQLTLLRLDRAYASFFRRIAERKKGKKIKAGFPRFKSERRFRSLQYSNQGYKVLSSGHLQLTKIGTIRMFKHREIKGQIKTLVIKKDGVGDWYAILTVQLPDVPQREIKTRMSADAGLIDLLTTNENEKIKPKKFYRESESQLKILNRRVSRKVKGSNNRKKAIRRLAKVHRKVERQRDDFLHKVSRTLANKADLIAFEKLNIQNMLKNHRLAKSISDASWGKLMRYTNYKAANAGGVVVYVDPRGTSQICSRCGALTRISLSERSHACTGCGFTLDRDWNAALNILQRVGTDSSEPIQTPVEISPLPLPSGGGK